jgi:hypothetical protein
VSQRNRQQGDEHRRTAFFLKAEGQRKQPAHGWIQAVVSPEKRKHHPGPSVTHEYSRVIR